jgi:hypothetical protein
VSPREEINQKKREIRATGILEYPLNSKFAHGTLLVFKKYKYKSPGDRTINVVGSTNFTTEELSGSAILLPLPRELAESFRVQLGDFSQGVMGDAVSQGASYLLGGGSAPSLSSIGQNIGLPSTQTVLKGAGSVLGAGLGFLASKYMTKAGAKQVTGLGALVGGGIDTSNLASSIEAGAGATVNPKQALQFKGVDLRTHNFSWTMAPTSPDESDEIKNIINTVKKHSLPSYGAAGPLKRAFLSYPSTVDIFFFGINEDYFTRYKTCMIENFNFNYSPNGVAIMRGGKPAMVNMSMTLKEMDIHTAEDYGGAGGSDLEGIESLGEDLTGAFSNIVNRASTTPQ